MISDTSPAPTAWTCRGGTSQPALNIRSSAGISAEKGSAARVASASRTRMAVLLRGRARQAQQRAVVVLGHEHAAIVQLGEPGRCALGMGVGIGIPAAD